MSTEILKLCKNYQTIVECEFLEEDEFSKKLVEYYKHFISATNLNDNQSVQKTIDLDSALYKYIEDYNFSKKLRNTIDVATVVSDNFSYLDEFMDYILVFCNEYEKLKDNVVLQTKWI